MTSYTDRLYARAALVASHMANNRVTIACVGVPNPIQYLDVRVRDTHAGNAPVQNAQITITDAAGVQPPIVVQTDQYGDAIVPIPVAGSTWDVEAVKDWFLPEPATVLGTVVAARTMPVVNLVLEQLRYYLHVDADRDGNVDNRHEGLNAIAPWAWGADRRGAIILCNNDHDDGLAMNARNPDHEDGVVNQGNDGTHELAPLEIRRVGPNTAPPAATNWQATLRILGGNEDKIRIFTGMNAADVQLIGAAFGAVLASHTHVYNLRVPGPPLAAMPTAQLGMEATTYPRQGFDGRIRVELTVTKASALGGWPVHYSTAAELRVAPWMMPNHTDHARRVYVVDCGPDVMAGGILASGNQAFRAALGVALVAAGVPAADFIQQVPAGVASPHRDRWMQDCMEIGYSVLPRNTGGSRRHRIEAVMQAFRDQGDYDLKEYPRQLLDQDFGYHFPGEGSATTSTNTALILPAPPPGGPPPTSPVFDHADDFAFQELVKQGQGGNLPGVLGVPAATAIAGGGGAVPWAVNNAAQQVAVAVEAVLLGGTGSALAAKPAMITAGIAAIAMLGFPFAVPAVAAAVAHAAATGAVAASTPPATTYDSCGNLECTPPCRADGAATAVAGIAAGPKDYPAGRIYYGPGPVGAGQRFDLATQQFLEAQRVQLPIAIDTAWLEVGHVDEMMSFIPVPGPPFRDWRLLLASPRRAFELMDLLPAATAILVGRQLDFGAGFVPVNSTVGVLRNGAGATPIPHPNRPAGPPMTGAELRAFNLAFVQARIDGVANQLVHEIGVVPAEIIHVPVIFMPGGTMNVAGALTADMVNMLVVNDHCIIPQPFGPFDPVTGLDEFEESLTGALAAANPALVPHYIDDWYTYHARMGEIHCGTNTNRRPAAANLNAWLASQDAEWWRFDG